MEPCINLRSIKSKKHALHDYSFTSPSELLNDIQQMQEKLTWDVNRIPLGGVAYEYPIPLSKEFTHTQLGVVSHSQTLYQTSMLGKGQGT